MENLELLRKEMRSADLDGLVNIRNVILWQGHKKHYNLSRIRAKAEAKAELFSSMPKKFYKHDLVLGSVAGIFSKSANPAELSYADRVCESYGINDFETNRDHFTPDFEYFLAKGIGGVIKDIEISRSKYASDPSKSEFLACCKICLEGLSSMALSYADTAEKQGKTAEGKICRNIVKNPPQSFREALQLVWLIEESFFAEGRDAMALGRMDMYLLPFYENDVKKGVLTPEFATQLLACTLLKIDEHRLFSNTEDVINICIGGEKPCGGRAANELTYLILDAVRLCAVSGPNLSARVSPRDTDKFLDAVRTQLAFGADEYAALFNNKNDLYNPRALSQPYLSCFCQTCIERGLDIRGGGAPYPSAHGAGLTGIATAADSLAAIEEVVFDKKYITLAGLRDVLKADFKGHENIRALLIAAPKYGNNNDFADKYAVRILSFLSQLFKDKRTRDGGPFYLAMASNVQNISEGRLVSASADGRGSERPLSDAASPMRGRDVRGLTALIHSVTKPDYTQCACGTVINLKFTGSFFKDRKKRDKLRDALRIYFERGGQEIQINCVSEKKLKDAAEHPENYEDLVVRVSGFSAFYTHLSRAVQMDILERTEYE